jgi:hypothetical protein
MWYIFPRFGMLHLEKSGNPGRQQKISGEKKSDFEEVCQINRAFYLSDNERREKPSSLDALSVGACLLFILKS